MHLLQDQAYKIFSGMQNNRPIIFTYLHTNVKFSSDEQLASLLGVPGYTKKPQIYNHLSLSFWTSNGPDNMCLNWLNADKSFKSGKFGKTKDQIQKTLKILYNSAGIKIMASAFGGGDKPTTSNKDPITQAKIFARFIKENNLDGADVNYQDREAFIKGTAPEWLISFQTQLRKELGPKYIITHSPEVPYFCEQNYKNGGYMSVHKKVGETINFYNIQFYNQGAKSFDTYQLLFEETLYKTKLSVKQLVSRGIQMGKIVIGKPSAPEAVNNSGYIKPDVLRGFFEVANKKINWRTGLMTWKYSYDRDCQFAKTVTEPLSKI